MKPISMRGDRLAFFIEVLEAIDSLQLVSQTGLNLKQLRLVLAEEAAIDMDEISAELAIPAGGSVGSMLAPLLLPNVNLLQGINLDITDFIVQVLGNGRMIGRLARAIAAGFITPKMLGSKVTVTRPKENHFEHIVGSSSDRLRNLAGAEDEPLV